MANAKIPRVVDGACVCELCCAVFWLNEWDCVTMAWKTPTLLDNRLIAGPCPSDSDWAYTTGCFAQATFYYPVAAADFCSECPDPPPTPPTNTLPMPSSCCETSCCKWTFEANWNCVLGEFEPTFHTSQPNQPCDEDSDWFHPLVSSSCFYRDCAFSFTCGWSKIMYTSGPDCATPPDPGPPPPGEPVDCCTWAYCVWCYSVTFDCSTGNWEPIQVCESGEPSSGPAGDSGWIQDAFNACVFTRQITILSTDGGGFSECDINPQPTDFPFPTPPVNCCDVCDLCPDAGEMLITTLGKFVTFRDFINGTGDCSWNWSDTYTPFFSDDIVAISVIVVYTIATANWEVRVCVTRWIGFGPDTCDVQYFTTGIGLFGCSSSPHGELTGTVFAIPGSSTICAFGSIAGCFPVTPATIDITV